MKRFTSIFFAFLFVFVLGDTSAVRADAVDQFLEDVAFTQSGYGPTNALKKIDARLAKGDFAPEDRARVLLRKMDILRRLGFDSTKRMELLQTEFLENPRLSIRTKLTAYEQSMAKPNGFWLNDFTQIFIPFLEKLLEDPEVQKNDELFISVNMKLGARQGARSFYDLAASCYGAAAARMKDPEEKAKALLSAALAARHYRDMEASGAYLDAVGKIPDLSFEIKKRALLIHGENAIYPDQYDWKPTKEGVAEARKYIDEALSDHSPLLGKNEASRVIGALIHAQAKAGDPKGAIAYGKGIFESPIYQANSGHEGRWMIADAIADVSHAVGNYKDAVKFYEKALRGYPDKRDCHMRIANSARAQGDFFRAMQAYGDAIKLCNPVEEKQRIQYLTGQIRLMNKSVRKGSSSFDSEAIFSDTNEDINELTLDEE